MVSKKLTKQEIREDRVATAATQAVDYVRTNARWVIGGVAVVLVVLTVSIVIAQGRTRAERDASSAMFEAQSYYFMGDYSASATQFRLVADQYGSANSARLARLFEGNSHLAIGSATAAEEAFRQFLGKSGRDPIVLAAARRGLGGALAGQGKHAEAAEEYARAAGVQPNPLAAEDWLAAGRAWAEAGRRDEAVQAFRSATEAGAPGQNQAALEARVRMQEVLAR